MEIKEIKLQAGLYIVATPIGNLRDITLRALDVISSADIIACEDTRVTNKLLSAYLIKKKMLKYNDHSKESERNRILDEIRGGKSVALLSDAGTPLISDPGYKLVKEAVEEGVYVTTIPGASSVISALTLSSLPTDRFLFGGFLPPKSKGRKDTFAEFEDVNATLVFFESGNRLQDSIGDLKDVLGDREISVVREISKSFEEVKAGKAGDVFEYYAENGKPKGEIVIVVSPPSKKEYGQKDIDYLLMEHLKDMSVKDASLKAADQLGLKKKELYQRALELKSDE